MIEKVKIYNRLSDGTMEVYEIDAKAFLFIMKAEMHWGILFPYLKSVTIPTVVKEDE